MYKTALKENPYTFLKQLWKLWMYFCTFIVSGACFVGISFFILSFIFFGNPYIDSCLDLGGRWNYEIKDCKGSAAYIEWKERTWW
jgi:hypothetical protein